MFWLITQTQGIIWMSKLMDPAAVIVAPTYCKEFGTVVYEL